MAEDPFKEFVQDQLQDLGRLDCRAMFGGHGLYRDKVFFGILYKGRLYFKTNESTRPFYLERGMKPFRPNAKQTLKNYYEVPAEIIEDQEELIVWASRAVSTGTAKKFAVKKKTKMR